MIAQQFTRPSTALIASRVIASRVVASRVTANWRNHSLMLPLPRILPRILRLLVLLTLVSGWLPATVATAGPLQAGAAKIDITHEESGPVNDRLYARALVLKDDHETIVLVSVDAVAIGEIGPIRNDYLGKVRAGLAQRAGLKPHQILINASHCHGIVSGDVDERTIKVVEQALAKLEPVKVGTGIGHEDRISENRRMKLKSGREADVRHAYSLPPDEEVESVGPIDPQIGILRVDSLDGQTKAVLYQFACHPIQGVPLGGNTADLTGFSSQVIEENLNEGAVALFWQGCGGDINPIMYKQVDQPRNAEALGNMLGLSTLRAIRKITCQQNAPLKVKSEILELPRADLGPRIITLQAEQAELVKSLQGTSLNLKTFLPLMIKYNLASDYPAYYSHRYLHEKQLGRGELEKLDADNRRNIEAYIKNIHTMEQLTRVQTNLSLLKMHHAQNLEAGKRTVDVEVNGVRVGEFVLVTFPGELTVQIGLNIKKSSPHPRTFVSGYTNGYIYYAPTDEQLQNVGNAQEDSDSILAAPWQKIFEAKVAELLKGM